ncbi:MAG: low temperature requirement protein A [Polyangiaceae bacterium]|nr:low temperature requirement protein A [Polyangiaceae bacterium]
MRSRWFHRPFLHSPALGLEKKATWIELFYDLIFVAAFIQLGNGLSSHTSVKGFLGFAGVFVPLWVAWTGFTFFENRYTLDDFSHRLLVFLQMFAVGAMAISAPGVLDGHVFAFSLSAGIAQLVVAGMYLRAYLQVSEAVDYSRFWGLVFAFGGALWVVAAFMPPLVAYGMWGVGTVGVLGSPLSRQSRELSERFPLDFEHLGERYGLLTLIVLGESFVKVLSALAGEGVNLSVYGEASLVLLVTCSLWWVYFDDIAGSRIRSGGGQWVVWLYFHIPLQIGFTAVGVAVKKAVHFGWDQPAPEAYRYLLAGSLAVAYFSVAAIDSVTERRQAELSDRARINARWGSALLLLLLAPAGGAMSGGAFLSLVLLVTVAQVAFDMMMAPFEEAAHTELGAKTTAEITRERHAQGNAAPAQKNRPVVTDAVRKGTPSELRRDLYFYFIEGSWTRVFVAFAFLFVITNVFFAALYTLDPQSISGGHSRTFTDAFFFSVQTLATIGYGALSPGNVFGDVIVTVEAAVGLIGVALTTGLVFAKASRARASVLFSKYLVVTRMEGKRVLMLRAGNARGNEVVDATMTLHALVDELTPEGHHFRRVRDLRLTRDRSPMFVLSWAVMHEIDEQSPLGSVDWDKPLGGDLISIVVTLMGHDGTYGQTIYARHIYYPDDIRVNQRFEDVISQLPDGRLMIDYGKFHDTLPDAAAMETLGLSDPKKNGDPSED